MSKVLKFNEYNKISFHDLSLNGDASFNNDVFISNNLVTNNDIQCNNNLFILGDVSWNPNNLANNCIPSTAVIGGAGGSSAFSANGDDIYFNNGNVGIGTTSPNYPLHIHNPNAASIFLQLTHSTSGTAGSSGAQLLLYGADTFLQNTNTSGDIRFRTAGYNDRMTIDHAGNVGIGTNNPTNKLHVYSSDNTSNIKINNATSTAGFILEQSTNKFTYIRNTESTGGIIFHAGNSEKMRINASGAVGIATTSTSYKLNVSGKINCTSGMRLQGNWDTVNYTNAQSDYLTLGGSVQGDPPSYGFSLHAANAIEAQALVVTSDRRIKDNIEEINDDIALQQIRQLRPSTYTYKDTYMRGSDPVIGFIAQEVREVLPYAVMNKTSAIPNILKPGRAHIMENNITELRLEIPLDDDMQLTNTSIIKVNVNNTYVEVNVVFCPNKNVIEIITHEDITDESVIVVYGELVEDFHCLNKESIFTVATAALQEVDRQLQAEKAKTASLETQLADVLSRLSALENN